MPTPVILFDDAKGMLSPLTDLRPSFLVRTGAMTTAERLIAALDLDPIAAVVPADLAELASEQVSVPVNTVPEGDDTDEILLINGRCVLPIDAIGALEPGHTLIECETQDMVAARLTRAGVRSLLTGTPPEMRTIEVADRVLMRRPWDWAHTLPQALAIDLAHVMTGPSAEPHVGVTVLGEHPVHVHPSATVSPTAVLDATAGPVVIDENATVRPLAIIKGPAYIGPGSTVLDHALIKEKTAIGPVCKVAGEVGGTVFQGYANKGHAGHLGDSWVGEWVNLGADTTNSNLLNTYTTIKLKPTPDASYEDTGLTFLGAVLGDHTKTAIATRIMTGAMVGTGTMHAATEPLGGWTAPYSWNTDAGTKPFRLGKFVEVAMTVMARRGVQQSQAYARRLTVLHERATGTSSGMGWEGKPA
ncbi:MAG: hypothetical protein DHS20C14_10120 [Phycisphaeraceae bacterium]|nr:MAG: hypothetical protein DHS20C14_10120 [Phycisphaeraceae bacterium]